MAEEKEIEQVESKKVGRPPIEVDEKLLKTLSKFHLSDKVIAECLGISVDTLHRRFADQIELYKSQSKSKIAEILFDEALNKREPWALKALAQKHLDYHDKFKAETENVNLNANTEVSTVDLFERIKQIKGEE